MSATLENKKPKLDNKVMKNFLASMDEDFLNNVYENGSKGYTFPDFPCSCYKQLILDNAAKNLVEGCIFIDFPDDTSTVNWQSVYQVLPGYIHSNGNKITVELKNRDSTNQIGLNVHVYDTKIKDLELLGTNKGIKYDLYDFINSAHVVVSHTNGKDVKIECTEIDHTLSLYEVVIPTEYWDIDNRSPWRNLCVHKDVSLMVRQNVVIKLDHMNTIVHHK